MAAELFIIILLKNEFVGNGLFHDFRTEQTSRPNQKIRYYVCRINEF